MTIIVVIPNLKLSPGETYFSKEESLLNIRYRNYTGFAVTKYSVPGPCDSIIEKVPYEFWDDNKDYQPVTKLTNSVKK